MSDSATHNEGLTLAAPARALPEEVDEVMNRRPALDASPCAPPTHVAAKLLQSLRKVGVAVCLLMAWVLLVHDAGAVITQPDGKVVPVISRGNNCRDKNVQACLNAKEGASGLIDAIQDAEIQPEIFDPVQCMTFEVRARGAGFNNVFGWYNATNSKPADTDLHAFLLCGDDVGTVKTLNIQNDPKYKGGQIGFFMVSPEGTNANCPTPLPGGGFQQDTVGYIYYSEAKYNPDNTNEPYIHLLIWQSVTFPNAFYFGWEDLLSGGDNDFDDLLTFVSGIQCTGGGDPCATGLPGICAEGTMQCQKGELKCVSNQRQRAETCDSIDEDCNGVIDNGDPCEAGHVCIQGRCLRACGEVVYNCTESEVCGPDGYCIDPACSGITCNEGQVCREGTCQSGCDGVVCPTGKVCRAASCVNPCDGITCDPGQVCVAGVCGLSCSCLGCPAGKYCEVKTGICESEACLGVVCPKGTLCAAGQCVDPCLGAVCPAGQKCSGGACVALCSGINCPTGQKCIEGVCADSCVNIQCGPGFKCVAGADNQGACVDACTGVTCGEGATCELGACPSCDGVTCPDKETCDGGVCANPCTRLTCADGEVCRDGACENSCTGVVCETWQVCEEGLCVSSGTPIEPVPSGGAGGMSGSDSDAGLSNGGRAASQDSSSCACSTVGGRASPIGLGLLALAVMGLTRRRRT